MASQSAPRLLVELAPHSVQLALVNAAGRLEGFKECALDAASVTATLAEIAPGVSAANAQVLLVPPAGFVLRSTAEEAASMRTAKSLLSRAESAPHGLEAPLSVVALDAVTGVRVDTVGSTPWVLAGVATAQVDATKAQLTSLGFTGANLRLALPVRIGAVVTALQDMPEATRVLVWQVGETDAQLACVSAAGCEAAGGAAVGFTQIYEAVQAGLGLKFRAAASKLFFNNDYDFSETAGPVAERLAALLRPAIATLGCAPTALHVAGLPAGQAWLAKAVAAALELAPLSPDIAAFCAQRGLTGGAVNAALPVSALGVLFQASAGEGGGQGWQPEWLDVNAPAPAAPAPVVVATAPAPVAAAAAPVAPKPAAPVVKAPAAPAPAPLIKSEPVPVTSSGSASPIEKPGATKAAAKIVAAKPVAAAPAAAPVITPAPIVKPVAPAPVAAKAEVKAEPKVETKIETKVPAKVEPVKAAAKVETKPAAAPDKPVLFVTEPVAAPVAAAVVIEETREAVAPKKKPAVLFAAIAAVVVLGGAGAFFAMKGKSGGTEVAPTPAVAAVSAEEARMREAEEARMLAEELKTPRSFRNDRYSFEVSDRGFLRKLVGVGNRTIIDEFGWLDLQGVFTGTSKPFYAGTMGDKEFTPSITKLVRDGKVVFEIKGMHPRFMIETVVTCLPDKLQVETVFKPFNMQEARGPISGVYTIKMNRQSLSLGQRAVVEPGIVTYSTQSGPMALKFNGSVWGAAGEEGKQTVSVGGNMVFFYFTDTVEAKNNVLRAEITLP